ncbi:MAG: periplasmic heavy metal sensor [Bacteroidota bacterium]|nr:periplasmic heavy metal sensor [Bacteroidota bacterium]
MKNSKLKISIVVILLLASFSFAEAQRQGMKGNNTGPMHEMLNLTDEQDSKITELRTNHMSEMLPLKNDIKLKEAELTILTSADKADMAAINSKLDEISEIKLTLAKNREAHRQDVRSILNTEQRIKFDLHASKRSHHKNKKGYHNGRKMNKREMMNK